MHLQDNEQLNIIIQSAPIGVCILDAATLKAELLNAKFLEIAGKPKEAILGKWYWEPFAEVRHDYEAALTAVAETGKPYRADEVELKLIRHGREENIFATFVYAPVTDAAGKVSKIAIWVLENTRQVNQQRTSAASEERLTALITAASDVVYSLSADWEIMHQLDGRGFLKDTHEPITGWRNQNVHPDDMAMVNRKIAEAIKDKKIFQLEHKVLRADGSPGWTFSRAVPILDTSGEILEWFGMASDITDRKDIEAALAQSSEELQAINEEMSATNEEQAASNEELAAMNHELAMVNEQLQDARRKIAESDIALRLAINAANFGTWYIHSVTRDFITDARLKELFGYYPDEDLSIEQALAQITDEYRGFVATKLENAIYHNGDYDVTYPVIGLHDNQLRWLRAIGNLKADPSGAFSAFTGVVMDITAQHLAAEKIAHAEEDLRLAIESGELATWYLNEKQDIITASARFHHLFGFGPTEEISYEAAINQIPPDFREQVRDAVNASFNTGKHYNVEHPVIGLHDSKQRWVRSVGKFVVDEKEGNYITGVMADITEQKMDDIRKNDFIGMVSHELKTPLTSLAAIVQVLTLKLRQYEDPFVPGALEKASSQVKKMGTMINGFLNISRLESGKILIDKQPFIIGDLIKESISEANMTGLAHIINLDICDKVIVRADRDKIGSVITNLLSNAAKYSPKGSSITVNCYQAGQALQVSVTDEGIGIRPEDRDKIFNRFYRVQDNLHVSGFGIGLYLSAEIIERHNGRIWVESGPGKGSIFYFSLPLN